MRKILLLFTLLFSLILLLLVQLSRIEQESLIRIEENMLDGQDLNKNGVRDDVEERIKNLEFDKDLENYVYLVAIQYQKALTSAEKSVSIRHQYELSVLKECLRREVKYRPAQLKVAVEKSIALTKSWVVNNGVRKNYFKAFDVEEITDQLVLKEESKVKSICLNLKSKLSGGGY